MSKMQRWLTAKRWRIYAVLIVLSVVPLLAFLTAADRMLRKLTSDSLSRSSLSASTQVARLLEERFAADEAFMNALAAQPDLTQAWERGDTKAATHELQQACSLNVEFALCGARDQSGALRIVSRSDIPVLSNDQPPAWVAEYFREPRTYVSGAFQPAFNPGQSYIAVAAPMRLSPDKPAAMVVGLIPMDRIVEGLRIYLTGSATRFVTVVDQNGRIVAEPDAGGYRIAPHMGNYEPVKEVLAGHVGTGRYTLNGKPVLATHYPIPMLHWGVLIQVPMAELDKAIWQFEKPLAWAGLGLLLLALVFGLIGAWLYRKLRESEYGLRRDLMAASEKRYQALFDSSPQPMYVYDFETLRILDANATMVQKYGYSREELLNMTIMEIRPAEDAERVMQLVEAAKGGEAYAVTRHRHKNGKLIDVEGRQKPIQFAGRSAALVLATDITDKLLLEEQFRQAQKMEAVGRLAGGVAHDFNNILMLANSYAELILGEPDLKPDLKMFAGQITKACGSGAAVTQQLLAFSRKQLIQPKVISLNFVLERLETMLPRLIGEDVTVGMVPAKDLAHVLADPGQMEQILMNLAVNARDAMPNGGRLTIETANVEIDGNYGATHDAVPPGLYVMLAVSDTGHGMDAETQKHIFEPFFTTKERGRGTGLGLATVYGIVKQSNGHIWVYSEPGHGTTFKLYFPRVGKPAEEHMPLAVPATPQRGTETILLLEDESGLRIAVKQYLQNLGYQVLEAGNGVQCRAIANEPSVEIDLFLTDMVLPDALGADLAQEILIKRPGLPCVYMSGYTDRALGRNGDGEQERILQKPISLAKLATIVRTSLDHARVDAD